jgi:hypothetical protein
VLYRYMQEFQLTFRFECGMRLGEGMNQIWYSKSIKTKLP